MYAENRPAHRRIVSSTFLLGLLAASTVSGQPATPGQLVISEFRVRGPNGANDEFIEIYNASGADHTVMAALGPGYGIAASDGVTRCSIPNGTVIPNRGHYLCVNSVGYSLGSYPAGNSTTATAMGDATYATNIPDNAGIALFNITTGSGYPLENRIDAVGPISEANPVFREGAGLPSIEPSNIDYAWVRDACGKDGSITRFGVCPSGGLPTDTNRNDHDFYFVEPLATEAGGIRRLGAPAPENLSSPISGAGAIQVGSLDHCVSDMSPPNFVRDLASDPGNDSTHGTIDVRRTFKNSTGADVTRLRFRILDLTTFEAPLGIADLRPRTAGEFVAVVQNPPFCVSVRNVAVPGTTLEQPPSQLHGGGFNSSMSAGGVTLAAPLANGASLPLRFLFGVQQKGAFRLAILVEALPKGSASSSLFEIRGCTDGCPAVASILRTDPSPTSSQSPRPKRSAPDGRARLP